MSPRSLLPSLLLVAAVALAGCDDGGPRRVHCPQVPSEAGTAIFGEVYRADGASARGSYIEARGPYGAVLHASTGTMECFALRVQPGDWTVVASQDGWAGSASARIADGEQVGLVLVMYKV